MSDELLAALGNARIVFWACPLHSGQHVQWTDDKRIAVCCVCGNYTAREAMDELVRRRRGEPQ